ncbi:hypothetical protein Efla_002166 [Eimeria flavescens]
MAAECHQLLYVHHSLLSVFSGEKAKEEKKEENNGNKELLFTEGHYLFEYFPLFSSSGLVLPLFTEPSPRPQQFQSRASWDVRPFLCIFTISISCIELSGSYREESGRAACTLHQASASRVQLLPPLAVLVFSPFILLFVFLCIFPFSWLTAAFTEKSANSAVGGPPLLLPRISSSFDAPAEVVFLPSGFCFDFSSSFSPSLVVPYLAPEGSGWGAPHWGAPRGPLGGDPAGVGVGSPGWGPGGVPCSKEEEMILSPQTSVCSSACAGDFGVSISPGAEALGGEADSEPLRGPPSSRISADPSACNGKRRRELVEGQAIKQQRACGMWHVA